MESQKQTSRVINVILATVRGPGFLFGMSAVLLLAAIPAEATLLRGYLQQNVTTEASSTADEQPAIGNDGKQSVASEPTKPASLPEYGARTTLNSGVNKSTIKATQATQPEKPAVKTAQAVPPVQETQTAPPFQFMPSVRFIPAAHAIPALQAVPTAQGPGSIPRPDSFPVSFEGAWRCVTVVTESAVPTVHVGERVESEVAFLPQNDGRIVALWNQTGWAEAAEAINTVSNVEANLERTNYYKERSRGNGWAAHSRDHYLQIAPNRIAASSDVDQFIDGQFLGQYRTKSMLFKLDPHIALIPQQN